MKNLLLTLGHNSSAVLVDNHGNIICGYEEERLTRIKSDSHFPQNAIEKCLKKSTKIENVFISHWFDDFDFHKTYNEKINKYYNYQYMDKLVEKFNCKLNFLSPELTHHSSHAYASIAFFNNKNKENLNINDFHIICIDGFGNKQEVATIFKIENNKPIEVNKIYDYMNSLGLMYQYATSFTKMKENQDEYKYLGYESKIGDIGLTVEQINDIYDKCEIEINRLTGKLTNRSEIPKTINNEFISLEDLTKVKTHWYNFFNTIVDINKDTSVSYYNSRCIIGTAVQYIIENVCLNLIKYYKIQNVILCGGVFYNVKLNNRIMKNVDNICIMPIAGDQACGFGLYYNKFNKLDYSDLCFGQREFINRNIDSQKNIYMLSDKKTLIDKTVEILKENKIPQIVFGNMEFGPRALCHTSSLCIPTQENVSLINQANNRNEIMPCAPVILERNLNYFFNSTEYSKVIGSDEYMILTYDYKFDYCTKYGGIMHKYPQKNICSGRPQVIREKNSIIYHILDEMDKCGIRALVNTSYNYHGKPIVYSIDDAINDYENQIKNSNNPEKLSLLIGTF